MSLGMLTLYGPTTPAGFSGTWTPSSGAPTLSGTNAALCLVLDWAMAQKSWTTTFTSTNARVYKQPAGLGNSLLIQHDSAITGGANFATWRGAESATAATTAGLTSPFPVLTQTTDAQQRVQVSVAAGATATAYTVQISDRFVRIMIQSGASNAWFGVQFGDCAPTYSGDNYFTMCTGVGATASVLDFISASSLGLTTALVAASYVDRSIDGTLFSELAAFQNQGNNIGVYTNQPVAKSGYLNRILRDKIFLTTFGSKTTTAGALAIPKRVWIPNLWNPLHNGLGATLATLDTFTDTAYNASSLFRVYAGVSGTWCILEESDTWSIPSG